MLIRLNGRRHDVAEGSRLSDVLAELGASVIGVAVAVDDELVPRSGWPTHRLVAGAKVEVVTAVQGG
jgi:sulfur carrier protein